MNLTTIICRINPNLATDIISLVKLGKYDWVNDDAYKFSYEKTDAKEIELVSFDKAISSEDAIKEMDKNGLRPATATELLILGAEHPELQRNNPIVALGSVRQFRGGGRVVASLRRGGSERDLRLRWFDCGWSECYRFAAVRKSSDSVTLGSGVGPLVGSAPSVSIGGSSLPSQRKRFASTARSAWR